MRDRRQDSVWPESCPVDPGCSVELGVPNNNKTLLDCENSTCGLSINKQHFDYLDGWRGLAIGFLLLGHFSPVRGLDLGTFGVNLFFVLSGLLMAGLLFIQKTPIDVFYKRRISRIVPALFFFLCFIIFDFAATSRQIDWLEFSAATLLIKNYLTDIGH